MKSYKEFKESWSNYTDKVNHDFGLQCYLLAEAYFFYLFEVIPPWTPVGAVDYWERRNTKFANVMDKVKFSQEPSVGAWVVFDAPNGGVQLPYLHIGILDSVDNLGVFQMNYACYNFDVNGNPACPPSVRNMKGCRVLGYIAPLIIEENGAIQSAPIQLSPTQGIIYANTNVRAEPTTQSGIVTTLSVDTTTECSQYVIGEEVAADNRWVLALGGYISTTRFLHLPSQLNEVAQTPTPPVETPPEIPQSDIPAQNRLSFKALDGIRGRTTPRFEDNIYTEISGAGKSVNVLSIVDGAEYEGSNQWVKYMYDDIKEDTRDNTELYSHRSFFQ